MRRLDSPLDTGGSFTRRSTVYKNGIQMGKATSATWSPTLKKLIALATLKRDYTKAGTRLEMEITVEAVRHRVPATVVKTPFSIRSERLRRRSVVFRFSNPINNRTDSDHDHAGAEEFHHSQKLCVSSAGGIHARMLEMVVVSNPSIARKIATGFPPGIRITPGQPLPLKAYH